MISQILLIDIGNTRIKWYLTNPTQPVKLDTQPQALSHVQANHANEFPANLREQWQAMPTPDAVRISCVAQTILYQRTLDLIHQLWGNVAVLTAQTQSIHPLLTLNYDPAQMGSDRYMQLLGARSADPRINCVVVGVGTAITVDAVLANGMHIGGAILPSVRLMRSALHDHTAKLPLGGGAFSTEFAPSNTQDALDTGSVLASVGAVDAFIRLYCIQVPERIWVCGGDALQWMAHWQAIQSSSDAKSIIKYAPALGLMGLLAL